MINILIVDDNLIRVETVRRILDELQINKENITCVSSTTEAKRMMARKQFDILLVDLVLPRLANMPPENNGGIDLLREITITLADVFKVPRRIFIISEFDNAIQELKSIEGEIPYTLIKYDASNDEWSIRLNNYIEQILRIESEEAENHDYDAAIICALETPELDEVKRLPFEWAPHSILGDSTDYFIGIYKGKRLVCAAAYEMGLSSAAILSTKIESIFRPKYLIMTGIAGGVDKEKLHFGDVMVADPCFDYESGKKINENGESIFKPDYRQIRLDDKLNQIVRRLKGKTELLKEIRDGCTYDKPEESLKIEIGPFGSGAAVLSDSTVIARVIEHNRKFLGFDMEAYAVMLSGMLSSAPKTVPIVMKAVSDFGDGKTDKYQNYAAYTSARVLELFLQELFSG